jgi:prepilin-type N-terminal cleavage/methylation domain-containing protein
MRRRGFSLVEIAVVLVLAALMTGYVMKMKPAANAEGCDATTAIQLRDIQGAVARFVIANNRLPMPAARTQGVDDINYGREALAAALDVTSGITMGALPFQALGLPPSYAADCWGNKFTYAVNTTPNLTTTGGYSPVGNLGAITVKSNAANTITTTAAYVVVSHGADGVGAVARNYTGVSRNWCTLSSVLQTENCDIGNATFMSTEINDGRDSGNNKFDDIVVFRGKDVWAIDGVCAGTAGNCSAGTATGDNGVTCGTRTWVCNGSGGGANASCTLAMGSCLVNGVCNNTVALGCTAGTAGSDNGLTGCGDTRTWVCNGSGGGTNSGTCSFANTACAGVCNNSTPLGCTTGSAINDDGQTSCGTYRTWVCNTAGGNSGTCSYYNGACSCTPSYSQWYDWPCTGPCGPGAASVIMHTSDGCGNIYSVPQPCTLC